jgi:hypothetical protein
MATPGTEGGRSYPYSTAFRQHFPTLTQTRNEQIQLLLRQIHLSVFLIPEDVQTLQQSKENRRYEARAARIIWSILLKMLLVATTPTT